MEDLAPLAFKLSPLGASTWPMPDVAAPIYPAVDFAQCRVGGSHALRQYMHMANWAPEDVDIFCDAPTQVEFKKILADFITKHGQEKVEVIEREEPRYSREDFVPGFRGSALLRIEGVPIPVQFVGFNLAGYGDGTWPLEKRIAAITDAPASVSYAVDADGVREFYVPPTVANNIETGRVKTYMCTNEARRDKYEARGFVFEYM